MRPIFSILSAIANGKNTQAEIEAALGNKKHWRLFEKTD